MVYVLSLSRGQGPGLNDLELTSLPAALSVLSPLPHTPNLCLGGWPLLTTGTPPLRHLGFPPAWGAGPWLSPCSSAAASIPRLCRNSAAHQEKELCFISPLPTAYWNPAKVSFMKTKLTDVIHPSASSFIHSSYIAHLLHQSPQPDQLLPACCTHLQQHNSQASTDPALSSGRQLLDTSG